MLKRISVSTLRARLSQVLKELECEPSRVYEITVSGRVVGELRASERNRVRAEPGSALLNALEAMGEPEASIPAGSATARDHDRFLYGSPPKGQPRKST